MRRALSHRREEIETDRELVNRSKGNGEDITPLDYCLVLDEKAMEYLGLLCKEELRQVGNGSRSVVGCRMRKDQKAQMVSLIKEGVPGSCCLAIGDGCDTLYLCKQCHSRLIQQPAPYHHKPQLAGA